MSDQEIEEDLLQIRSLLQPKPFLVVSHITTYEHGKRYELVKLLENLCEKHQIPFFNPATFLREYSFEQVFEHEKVLAHYTSYGHEIIGKHYKRLIEDLINR